VIQYFSRSLAIPQLQALRVLSSERSDVVEIGVHAPDIRMRHGEFRINFRSAPEKRQCSPGPSKSEPSQAAL